MSCFILHWLHRQLYSLFTPSRSWEWGNGVIQSIKSRPHNSRVKKPTKICGNHNHCPPCITVALRCATIKHHPHSLQHHLYTVQWSHDPILLPLASLSSNDSACHHDLDIGDAMTLTAHAGNFAFTYLTQNTRVNIISLWLHMAIS